MNNAATKILVLNPSAERIYEINHNFDKLDSETELLFKSIDDTLQLICDELISAAGGYTREGQYFILPANEYVETYFYSQTSYRNNGHKYLFQSIEDFRKKLSSLYPESTFKQRINKKFEILDYYGVSNNNLFKELTIIEAVELIEAFRTEIALEQTEYLINKEKNDSQQGL